MMSTDLVVATPDVSALEADPIEYMAVVLHRAKGWLAEARSIEEVRETKAIAVGYESVIREKELAFDAQLSATEIVRRCERRIGELVHGARDEGRLVGPSDATAIRDQGIDVNTYTSMTGKISSSEVFPTSYERSDSYAMADAPVEDFEHAIGEAREEGNLSRANVVRKVKGEKPKSPSERSEWHRNRRHIDSNRILAVLAQELDAATSGLDLMTIDDLDPKLVESTVPEIRKSITTINRHLRRIQNG